MACEKITIIKEEKRLVRYFKKDKKDNSWAMWLTCGVSDGLVLPCAICKKKVYWDYGVKDEIWDKIVPKNLRRGVICLPCLNKMAKEKGIDIAGSIEDVQFTGIDFTIEFIPVNVFYYKTEKEK